MGTNLRKIQITAKYSVAELPLDDDCRCILALARKVYVIRKIQTRVFAREKNEMMIANALLCRLPRVRKVFTKKRKSTCKIFVSV